MEPVDWMYEAMINNAEQLAELVITDGFKNTEQAGSNISTVQEESRQCQVLTQILFLVLFPFVNDSPSMEEICRTLWDILPHIGCVVYRMLLGYKG